MHPELGTHIETFGLKRFAVLTALAINVGTIAASILVFGGAYAAALRLDANVAQYAITLCLGSGVIWLALGIRWLLALLLRARPVEVYERGIAWGQHAYRWEQIEGVQPFMGAMAANDFRYQVWAESQRVLNLHRHYANYKRLVNIIADHHAQHQFPTFRQSLADGQAITVGELTLGPDSLTIGNRTLARADAVHAKLEDIRFEVIGQGRAPNPTLMQWQPQSMALVLYILHEWLPRNTAPLDIGSMLLPMEYPTADLTLLVAQERLTITRPHQGSQQVPWERVGYAIVDKYTFQLHIDGTLIATLPRRTPLEAALLSAQLAVALPHAEKRLAAGETLDFGVLQLTATDIHDSIAGTTIRRAEIWRIQRDPSETWPLPKLTYLDRFERPLLAARQSDILNPHLLYALVKPPFGDVSATSAMQGGLL